MYVYKSINSDELSTNKGLSAKRSVNKDIKEALDSLKNGFHDLNSCWISFRDSFKKAAEEAVIPARKDGKNRSIVVLNTDIYTLYDGTDCKPKNIQRLIFKTRDSDDETDMYHILEHIHPQRISYILNAMDINILYAMLSDGKLDEGLLDYYLWYIRELILLRVYKLQLSGIDQTLFDEMFHNNKSLFTITLEILKNNSIPSGMVTKDEWRYLDIPDYTADIAFYNYNEHLDLLNLLAYLKYKKRNFIMRLLKLAGINVGEVSIPEDSLKIISIGRTREEEELELHYNGTSFILPSIAHHKDPDNQEIHIMQGNTDNQLLGAKPQEAPLMKTIELPKG